MVEKKGIEAKDIALAGAVAGGAALAAYLIIKGKREEEEEEPVTRGELIGDIVSFLTIAGTLTADSVSFQKTEMLPQGSLTLDSISFETAIAGDITVNSVLFEKPTGSLTLDSVSFESTLPQGTLDLVSFKFIAS